MKTIICDICGSNKNVESRSLPVYRTFDGCDGKIQYEHPTVHFETIDICEDCLAKCTNIHDLRVMGYGGFSISNNPELCRR